MKIELVDMTPALATTLLQGNSQNRLLSPRRVNSLAASMSAGHWRNDGNPVKKASDGSLIDGQHRLQAVVQSGVTVPMFLATGCDPDIRMTVDTGRPRTFRDYLHMQGIAQSADLAAMTRLIYCYRKGTLQSGMYRSTFIDTQGLWETYTESVDDLKEALKVTRMMHDSRITRSTCGTAFMIFSEIEFEDARGFFDELAMRATPSCGPRLLIRLTKDPAWERRHSDQQETLAYLIKAWNIYRKGIERAHLVWRRGGVAKEDFPEPV